MESCQVTLSPRFPRGAAGAAERSGSCVWEPEGRLTPCPIPTTTPAPAMKPVIVQRGLSLLPTCPSCCPGAFRDCQLILPLALGPIPSPPDWLV